VRGLGELAVAGGFGSGHRAPATGRLVGGAEREPVERDL
jgi:hypothetical protein